MRKRRLVVTAVCATFALMLVSTAAATADVTVTVDGEEVDDGETFEVESSVTVVNVSVESDGTLTSVSTETGSSSSIAGLDRSTYTTSRTVTVSGETSFSVEATDGDGTTTHEVTLRRSTGSASDAQQTLNDLQDRVDDIEGDIDSLEERRNRLQETRDNLSERLNETEGGSDGGNGSDGDGSNDGGGNGSPLPGFGVFVALVAFAAVGVARRF